MSHISNRKEVLGLNQLCLFSLQGGIVARFVIDDSSVCFINCHLAAGQHHTRERNNDVAAILEGKEVFPQSLSLDGSVAYAGGGDGSMVLDHEIVFVSLVLCSPCLLFTF